jgi:hypothetical protein
MKDKNAPKNAARRSDPGTASSGNDTPTREDAEQLLEKARAEVRRHMSRELDAERISNDLMNFRMKVR